MIKICKNCGKEYDGTKSSIFCCSKCYWEYKGKEKRVKVICKNCGKEEYIAQGRAKTYVYCSQKCRSEFEAKERKRLLEQYTITCPICGKNFYVKPSSQKRRVCCSKECSRKYKSLHTIGKDNPNYKTPADILKTLALNTNSSLHDKSRRVYIHIAKEILGLSSTEQLPKGWCLHHKDCNHANNDVHNLVYLPRADHHLLHRWFGNIMINALHTGKINRETFFNMCTEEQANFYKQIIDLDITRQVVVKQGELLENPEVDNQQPSIYRNIIEGSTTNSRVLADNAEDSNANTSALPISNNGDDIV